MLVLIHINRKILQMSWEHICRTYRPSSVCDSLHRTILTKTERMHGLAQTRGLGQSHSMSRNSTALRLQGEPQQKVRIAIPPRVKLQDDYLTLLHICLQDLRRHRPKQEAGGDGSNVPGTVSRSGIVLHRNALQLQGFVASYLESSLQIILCQGRSAAGISAHQIAHLPIKKTCKPCNLATDGIVRAAVITLMGK